MKKLIALLLALVMVLSMVACGAKKVEGEGDSTGIPAAVTLRETDALKGKKVGCSIVYKGDEWCAALADALE